MIGFTKNIKPSFFKGLYTEDEFSTIRTRFATADATWQVGFPTHNHINKLKEQAANYNSFFRKNYWLQIKTPSPLDGANKFDNTTVEGKSYSDVQEVLAAACLAWVTNNQFVKQRIKEELIEQTKIVWIDLTSIFWQNSLNAYSITNFSAGHFNFINNLAIIYLYVESAFTDSEKTDFESWVVPQITKICDGWNENRNTRFTNRVVNSNSFTTPETQTLTAYELANPFYSSEYAYRFSGGLDTNQVSSFARTYTNTRSLMLSSLLTGYLITKNNLYKNTLKSYAIEMLAYTYFPDKSAGEWHRGSENGKQNITGHNYSLIALSLPVLCAWFFWKLDKDSYLYNYSTSAGVFGTAGGAKSLLWAVELYTEHYNGLFDRYRGNQPVNATNKLDGVNIDGSIQFDITLAMMLNKYYNDNKIGTNINLIINKLGKYQQVAFTNNCTGVYTMLLDFPNWFLMFNI